MFFEIYNLISKVYSNFSMIFKGKMNIFLYHHIQNYTEFCYYILTKS